MKLTDKKKFWVLAGLLLTAMNLTAQNGSISGRIVTRDGEAAPFVTVQLKELKKGTMTDSGGYYMLQHLKAGDYTVLISFAGLQPISRKVLVKEGESPTQNFVLEENSTQLTEVVVTYNRGMNERAASSGKINIKPMDLPQSIAVLGKDVLERQQTLRLSDVLMNITGVYQYGNTGGTQEEIGGRGYAFNSSNTFKNGVRYNNASLPEISALEKVEVLKGSAAILYGNVAAGGVLNLVTKKPKFEKGGEVGFRTGSYDFYKPWVDVYGPINNSQVAAYRVNATYEKANSFRDVVNSERFYINPSFLFNIGRKTELLVEGDYLKDNRTSDFGTGAINYEVANVPRSRFLGASWSYYKTEQKTTTITLTHHLNKNWDIRSTSGYQGFNSDLFGTTRPNASSQFIQPDGRWVRGLQRSGTDENYYITQLDVTGKFNTGGIRHQLLLGADADKYVTDGFAYSYANPAIGNKNIYDTINVFDLSRYKQRSDIPSITATTRTRTPISRYGIYVQDLICLSEQFKILAGVRFSRQQTKGAYVDSLIKDKRTATAEVSDQAFTPRIGLVYQPVKQVSLFASYANSFTLNTGTDINLQPLKPSFINQYEAGVKTEFFEKLLAANVTVYQIVNSNLAQTALTDANGNPNSNSNIKELAGEVTSKGVEVDLSTKQVSGFQFIAGYSYNDTRYTKSNTYVEGSRLRYNPQHTANFSVYYSFSERSFLKGFNAGAVVYYVGTRVAGRSTRVQVPNDSFKLMAVPDYTQVDASIGYTWQKLSLRLKLSNVLNELSYNVHDDNSVNPIAPRMFSSSVYLRF